MTTTAPDPLVDAYLRQLRASARKLPRHRRDELVQQIQEHLDEAIPPGSSQADVRNALERLGDADAIVAEEIERLGIRPAQAGKLEWIVVVLLPIGFVLIPVLGWMVGVILLWCSRVWSTRDKLIGTLVPPGGLSALLLLAITTSSTCSTSGGFGQPTIEHCSGGLPAPLSAVVIALYVVGGIGVPIFLGRRAAATRS